MEPSDEDTVTIEETVEGNYILTFRLVVTPKQLRETMRPYFLIQTRLQDLVIDAESELNPAARKEDDDGTE